MTAWSALWATNVMVSLRLVAVVHTAQRVLTQQEVALARTIRTVRILMTIVALVRESTVVAPVKTVKSTRLAFSEDRLLLTSTLAITHQLVSMFSISAQVERSVITPTLSLMFKTATTQPRVLCPRHSALHHTPVLTKS